MPGLNPEMIEAVAMWATVIGVADAAIRPDTSGGRPSVEHMLAVQADHTRFGAVAERAMRQVELDRAEGPHTNRFIDAKRRRP